MSCPARVARGPVLAVAGDRAVDEAGFCRAQALVADAEAVEHAGPERLEQHVVLAREPQQRLAAAARTSDRAGSSVCRG